MREVAVLAGRAPRTRPPLAPLVIISRTVALSILLLLVLSLLQNGGLQLLDVPLRVAQPQPVHELPASRRSVRQLNLSLIGIYRG